MKYRKYKVETSVKLNDFTTNFKENDDERALEISLKKVRKKLGKLQDTLYAHGKYSVLICLQGMDTSGKDNLIREVGMIVTPII